MNKLFNLSDSEFFVSGFCSDIGILFGQHWGRSAREACQLLLLLSAIIQPALQGVVTDAYISS